MRLYVNHVILKVESRPALSSASCTSPEPDRDLVSVQAIQAPLSAFHPLMNTWQAYKTIQVENWNPVSNLGNNVVYSQATKWKAAHDGLMS